MKFSRKLGILVARIFLIGMLMIPAAIYYRLLITQLAF